MRYMIHFALLFSLCSAQAFAQGTQLVELIVFRQDNASLPVSQLAPDEWAQGATLITRKLQRTTQLDYLAKKLTPDSGYEVLRHQTWLQHSQDATAKVAVMAGPAHFEHYPVEGSLTFSLARNNKVQLDLWFNQFNPDHTLLSSERFKHRATVANDQVTFIDHYPFGALIRIQPQSTQASPTSSRANHAEDFE